MQHSLVISDSIATCKFSGTCTRCGKMSVGHASIEAVRNAFKKKKCVKQFHYTGKKA